ncbi:MAG TPA: phosphatidate cytidylyltransferase [Planctomycetota bacterium]|nr:phosphatidate cytidylyltransferase [Planctomycetota bacterium]
MKFRIVVGTLMVAGLAGLAVADHLLGSRILISALILIVGIAGWWELAVMSGIAARGPGGSKALFVTGLAATVYFLSLGWWEGSGASTSPAALPSGIAGLLFAAFLSVLFRDDHERGLETCLVTIAGPLLLGFLLSYFIRVYHSENGTLKSLVLVLGIKGNDVAALFVGRAFGKRHFTSVSPKKTLEGTLGAVLFSMVWFSAASLLWPGMFFRWPQSLFLGIILSIASQAGDLSESLFKRCYKVKDSSSLLPEFGGVLDLIDSVLFGGFLFWVLVYASPVVPG